MNKSIIPDSPALRDTSKAVMDALAVVEEKLGDLEGAKSTHLGSIRQDFANIKTSGGYNTGIGDVLEILSDSATFLDLFVIPHLRQLREICLPGVVSQK